MEKSEPWLFASSFLNKNKDEDDVITLGLVFMFYHILFLFVVLACHFEKTKHNYCLYVTISNLSKIV